MDLERGGPKLEFSYNLMTCNGQSCLKLEDRSEAAIQVCPRRLDLGRRHALKLKKKRKDF